MGEELQPREQQSGIADRTNIDRLLPHLGHDSLARVLALAARDAGPDQNVAGALKAAVQARLDKARVIREQTED